MSETAFPTSAAAIRIYPDAVLRAESVEVPESAFGGQLQDFTKQMLMSMYSNSGVGLAAPQLGMSARIVVADPTYDRRAPIVLVNPRIVEHADHQDGEEGCLSVPGVRAEVRRHDSIVVEYLSAKAEGRRINASGFLARILQHEIDHLEGTLFIDRIEARALRAAERQIRALEAKSLRN